MSTVLAVLEHWYSGTTSAILVQRGNFCTFALSRIFRVERELGCSLTGYKWGHRQENLVCSIL
jgi:hypothetical protein